MATKNTKSLFDNLNTATAPLAERLRPATLADVVGQGHLLQNGPIGLAVARGQPQSFVLWGPPGCGKTTLARLYAAAFDAQFLQISAVLGGVADIKQAIAQAQFVLGRTVLFVDEVHRFNKAQQDAFLPYVEDGTLIFVGATTENPSFSLNNALLSRAPVLRLNPLDDASLAVLLARACAEVGGLSLSDDVREMLMRMSHGDGRYLIGMVDTLAQTKAEITAETLSSLLQQRAGLYDKSGDGHYDMISVLHKAVRGSDVDAALFWFARMLTSGEDPRYVARRMLRMAVEDIGLADPQALTQVETATQVYERLGSPEGELALAQGLIYLALAPKSNAGYLAYKAARAAAEQHTDAQPPLFARNAPTKLMKESGYGAGYLYDHDHPGACAGQNYFPEGLDRARYYQPVNRGFERTLGEYLAFYQKCREEKSRAGKQKRR